ncbi:MAG: AAA family ATPase [Candidatus Omnitrophica bacterium]|nr:AAA family ATPase [Candidatus Omnitrophota bacterium]
MIRVIAIANQKGGCGKTTTTINLGACLARLNQRVLLVDLDPQAHTTVGLGILPEKLDWTLYDLFCPEGKRRPTWEEVVLRLNPYLYLCPGDLRLHQFEEFFTTHSQKEKQLKYLLFFALSKPKPFDYILLDCPPNMGLLTHNALEVSQEVIIPIEPSFFSLHGLAKISETLQRVCEKRGRTHETNALLTLFETHDRFGQEVYEEVKKYFQDRLFHTVIHRDGILREAAGAGLSIVDFDPNSMGYRDHMGLATEILERRWRSEATALDTAEDDFLRRSVGPRRVSGGVLFQYLAPEAKEVFVVGDFNQWVGVPLLRRNGNGCWQKVVPLRKGGYRYKFLVDGEWQLDPGSSEKKENQHGNWDSYVEIND